MNSRVRRQGRTGSVGERKGETKGEEDAAGGRVREAERGVGEGRQPARSGERQRRGSGEECMQSVRVGEPTATFPHILSPRSGRTVRADLPGRKPGRPISRSTLLSGHGRLYLSRCYAAAGYEGTPRCTVLSKSLQAFLSRRGVARRARSARLGFGFDRSYVQPRAAGNTRRGNCPGEIPSRVHGRSLLRSAIIIWVLLNPA